MSAQTRKISSTNGSLQLSKAAESFPSLDLIEKIGEGSQSTIYKVKRNGNVYALKVPKESKTEAAQKSLWLRREAALLARISHPALPKIWEVGTSDHPYLVMDFLEGQSLAQILSKTQETGLRLPEDQIRNIAETIADALAQVHSLGLLHSDIKPANIFVTTPGEIKLIDFGLSPHQGEIVGTLRYISPEQAGAIQLPIDARSDLYALGAVLYECATGTPPFTAESAAELIHQHATRTPIPPRTLRVDLSSELENAILKLLEKDPDNRFANARDLSLALRPREGELGPAPPSVIGREEENSLIRLTWQTVQAGNGASLYIEGAPGAGKSTLVQNFLLSTTQNEQIILKGKCQNENTLPFSVLREAVTGLAHQISILSPEIASRYKKAIREAAGTHKPLILKFAPQLLMCWEEKHEQPLSGETNADFQDVFFSAIAHFIASLTRTLDRPLILFLDDVQWMDSASRAVLTRITSEVSSARVFLLLAARSDSESITEPPLRSRHIDLQPLSESQIQRLVQSFLGPMPVDTIVAKKVFEVGRGSPFASLEILRSMIDASVLRPNWGRWSLDIGALESLQLPEDVIKLILHRLHELDAANREILQIAALLGIRFRTSALVLVPEVKKTQIHMALREGIRLNLLERIHTSEAEEYQFVHDRIQEALRESINPVQQRKLSDRIVIALSQLPSGQFGDLYEHHYSLAKHYSASHIEAHPAKVYQANFEAARMAHSSYANHAAYDFLRAAQSIVNEFSQVERPTREFHLLMGGVAQAIGRLSEAIDHYRHYLALTSDPLEKAGILTTLSRINIARIHEEEAQTALDEAFLAVGLPLPRLNVKQVTFTILSWTWFVILRKFRPNPGVLSKREQEKSQMIVRLYEQLGFVAYFNFDIPLSILAAFRPLLRTYYLEPSREVAASWTVHGTLIGLLKLTSTGVRYIRAAQQIAKTIENPQLLAHCLAFEGVCASLAGDERTAEKSLIETLENQKNWLSVEDLVIASGSLMWSLSLRGYCEDTIRWAQFTQERLDALGDMASQAQSQYGGWAYSFAMAAHSAQGRNLEATEMKRRFQEIPLQSPYAKAVNAGNEILHCIEQEDFGEPLEAAIAIWESLGVTPWNTPLHARQYFVFKAVARLQQYQQANDASRAKALDRLKKDIWQLRLAAITPVLKVHVSLMDAHWAHIHRNPKKALKYLNHAEHLALEVDSPYALYEIHRLRAEILENEQNEAGARLEARIALQISQRHGWHRRSRTIETKFGINDNFLTHRSFESSTHTGLGKSVSNAPLTSQQLKYQRFMRAILDLSAASSQVFDANQQREVVLKEMVRILHAERAFLFLEQSPNAQLHLALGQDSEGKILTELKGYSRSVIEEVRRSRQAVVVSGDDQGPVSQTASVVANGLKSILAAPLMIQEEFLGVIYLDNRLAKGVFTSEDVDLLLSLGNHIAVSLKTARNAEIEIEKATYQKDLEIVGAVQSLLLPPQKRYSFDKLEISSFYRPATQSGGDWWWVDKRPDGRVVIILGDVTGHGAGSAMITATIASAIRFLETIGHPINTETLLQHLHTHLKNLARGDYWMTLSAVEIDAEQESIQWWCAGSPPICLTSPQGPVVSLAAPSSPLGSDPMTIAYRKQEFSPGMRLYLYTDGTYDFGQESGKRFGVKSLVQLYEQNKHVPIDQCAETLWESLLAQAPESDFNDDIAIVIVEFVANTNSK